MDAGNRRTPEATPSFPSPGEREELARVIAGHANLDWGVAQHD